MVRALARHGLGLICGMVGAALLVFVIGIVRLSHAPLKLEAMKPVAERLIALQVPGSRAHIDRAELVYFRDAEAVGFRFEGVSVVDARRRMVLKARRFEVGAALDSMALRKPALAHVAARDFFAAVSVSPQGRYQLGYDASGAAAGSGDLPRLLLDLTSRPSRARPLSYLRSADLAGGRVAFRQVDGPVAWTARIDRIGFRKLGGNLSGSADVTIGEGQDLARFAADGQGTVGLKRAFARARVDHFVPARIFPALGATRTLAAWDAPVGGSARIAYAANSGIRTADIDLEAGAGGLRIGGRLEPLDGARLRATYDPAARQVR